MRKVIPYEQRFFFDAIMPSRDGVMTRQAPAYITKSALNLTSRSRSLARLAWYRRAVSATCRCLAWRSS
jgi:hypothetical protein